MCYVTRGLRYGIGKESTCLKWTPSILIKCATHVLKIVLRLILRHVHLNMHPSQLLPFMLY